MLDIEPENSFTFTNAFQTEEDLQGSNFTLHRFFRSKLFENEYLVSRGILMHQTYSSTAIDSRQLNQTAIMNNIYVKNWKNQYDIIYAANVILDNLFRTKEVAPERIDFYAGQAYFTKGMTYFDLARRWGDAVITTSSSNPTTYAKSHVMEVLQEAIRNAEEAYRLLPVYEEVTPIGTQSWVSKQYGCKGNSAALLAHLHAWRGSLIELCGFTGDAGADYESAIQWASLVIDKKVGNYDLEDTPEEVCTKSMRGIGNTSRENILEFETDEFQDYPVTYFPGKQYTTWPVNETHTPASVTYSPNITIKADQVKALYETDDLRRESYFYKLDSMSQESMQSVNQGLAYVYKWREARYITYSWSPTPYFNYLYANYTYWRLADIYLLRAECYAKLGDNKAVDDLNRIRRRAHATPYPAAGENDLQLAVFKEREKELILEGHRYYDIVRNGLDYIHTYLEGNFKTLTRQDIVDGALYFPVGSGAFDLNDKMRQTLYWTQYE